MPPGIWWAIQAGAMAHVDNAITNVANAFSGGSLDPQAYKSLMGANDGTLARIEGNWRHQRRRNTSPRSDKRFRTAFPPQPAPTRRPH